LRPDLQLERYPLWINDGAQPPLGWKLLAV